MCSASRNSAEVSFRLISGIRRFTHLAGGKVLVHQVDVGVGAERRGDPFEYGPRLVQTAGHDQMAYEQTSPGQPVIIKHERAHLSVHRFYGGTGGVWIVRRLHVYLAPLG